MVAVFNVLIYVKNVTLLQEYALNALKDIIYKIVNVKVVILVVNNVMKQEIFAYLAHQMNMFLRMENVN